MSYGDLFQWLKTARESTHWTVVILPLLYAVYKFLTWHFGFFTKLGVKGPRPWPLVGTLMPLLSKGLLQHDLEMKRLYGPVVGLFSGRHPSLMIYDPELLKAIMVKDFHNFQNRHALTISEYPLRSMLSMLEDDHWKHVRNTLTPTFSSGKLRKMQRQLEQCAVALLENLQRMADTNQIFDFREMCCAYTMDAIASTAFGMQVDSHGDPNNAFVRNSKQFFDFSLTSPRAIILIFFPFLVKPLSIFGFRAFPKSVVDFFVQAVDEAFKQRKSAVDDQTKADFLQLMVNAETQGAEPDDDEDAAAATADVKDRTEASHRSGLTHEEVLAQGIMFLLAGFETTASALSFLGYLLAVNTDCQDKLIEEIDEATKERSSVTYDDLNKMPYLDMCLSEALRLYPTGPRTDRIAADDITINGFFIPKGMRIDIPIIALQHDPDYWPEPEKFIPERFLPEAKAARNPFCYMPFGVGPRNCIGMRLAQMEVKMAIVRILQKFRLVVCEETQIPLELEKMRMRGAKGIKLRVQSRSASG